MGVLGFSPQRFLHKKYFANGGTGSGESYSNPAAIATGSADVLAIPAGTLIEKVYLQIFVAITGTTVLTVGDDDSATGFVTDQAANFATPGLYNLDAKGAGAYLRVQTAGATDAADIYVVPTAKFYASAGKEVKVVCTTANTAGAFAVWVEGLYLGR
jgi:hypothetical protein